MSERMAMLRWGAAVPADLKYARKLYHDEVIAAIEALPGARRITGVSWVEYDRDRAAATLAEAGAVDEGAQDFLRWLANNPDAVFFITRADYIREEMA